MANLTQARKEINAEAKRMGFIMREQNMSINGAKSYKFVSRKSGRVLVENLTFWMAYETAMSASSLDPKYTWVGNI